MRRFLFRASFAAFCATVAWLGPTREAKAQTTPPAGSKQEPTAPAAEPTPPSEPTPPGTEPTLPGSEPTAPAKPAATDADAKGNESGKLGSISWRDIVVVPRRPILKYHRVELIPTYNVSINNSEVRHHGFGGIINFFLSETLNLGVEGTYYQEQLLEHYFLRGLDDRVLPSINRYRWSATLNFGYVPFYGKFALFDRWIFQWEGYVQAGVGAIQTEWITRDPSNKSATNYDVTWHIDIGARFFLTKWLAVHAYLKDYMFVDKFEPTTRPGDGSVPPSNTFVSQFVQNIVFGVGVGMFLPTSFDYKYTR